MTHTKEECRAQRDEKHIREPKKQFGVNLRIISKGVGNDDEKKICDGDDQAQEKTDRGFPSMRGHTKRHTDQGKRDAGKWKRETLVQFRSTGAAFPFVAGLQLIDQLRDRQGRAAWSFFLLLVEFIKADR